jgi:hypothetical protein
VVSFLSSPSESKAFTPLSQGKIPTGAVVLS